MFAGLRVKMLSTLDITKIVNYTNEVSRLNDICMGSRKPLSVIREISPLITIYGQ